MKIHDSINCYYVMCLLILRSLNSHFLAEEELRIIANQSSCPPSTFLGIQYKIIHKWYLVVETKHSIIS
jgi:hypothetical protein